MGRVSVPSVGYSLSAPLGVIGLVGRYPTNYLIPNTLSPERKTLPFGLTASGTIGNYLTFRLAMPDSGEDTCLLLPRLPVAQHSAFEDFEDTVLDPLDLHALSTPPAFILS